MARPLSSSESWNSSLEFLRSLVCSEGCSPRNLSSLRSESSPAPPPFSLPLLVAVTTVCALLFAVGLVGNLLTMLVVFLFRELRSTTYLYLSSMALSDLCIFLLMPVDLYKLWKYQPWLLGDAVCKLSQFMSEGCTYSSILHITTLSMERYLAVCFPLRAKVLVTRGKVKLLIGLLWALALLSAGPVFALVGVELVNGSEPECRCTRYALSSGLLSAMMWVSSLYFLVPVCCLSVLYGLIGRKLWRRRDSCHRDRSHRQTVKMLAVIVLAFVLCWLPFHIGRTLFSMSTGTSEMYAVSQHLNLVSFVLFYLSAAINPILYNTMSARYRTAVCKLLGHHRRAPRGSRNSTPHWDSETNL